MHALGASLDGDATLWFNHLEAGSITRYDMFTDLLIEEWGVGIKQSIKEELGDDCVNENQFDEDNQGSNDEIANDCPSGFDFSSLEQTVDMPLNDSSMQENDDNEQISTLQGYNLGIDIEGELHRTLS